MSQKILAILFISFTLIIGGQTPPIFAYVMESPSYRMQLDSINIYGGHGTSTSYIMEDTMGEIGSGYSNSTSYRLHAGFQQNYTQTYISLTISDDISLSPSIPGMSGGTANGTTVARVETNDLNGYSLLVKATSTPAMRSDVGPGTYSFANYTIAAADPDYNWGIAQTDSEFGFTPEGSAIVDRYLDNGSTSCNQNGGTDTADRCWDSLSTSDKTVSTEATYNFPAGTITNLKFKAESGSSHLQPSGTYHATIVITAHVN